MKFVRNQITENGKTYEVRVKNYAKIWYLNDKLHREEGPAYEGNDNHKVWWFANKAHRENGHSIEDYKGGKEWWLGNEKITQKEHSQSVQKINKFYETCSVGDVLPNGLILLGKRNPSIGKIFKVYDIKRKEIRDELVYEITK